MAGPTWHPWRVILLAAMGEPLTKDELKTFTKFTGRTKAPTQRADELWCCIGRPRQLYTGVTERTFVPMEARS